MSYLVFSYKTLLGYEIGKTISKKIEECGSDTKELFKLVNHLTGHMPENQLLARTSDEELADELSGFFIQNIIGI